MNTILITGANRSIGFYLAQHYFLNGWRVIACCRAPEKATDLITLSAKEKERLKLVKLDVGNEEEINALTHELKNESIDILVNNAGIGAPPEMRFGDVNQKDFLEIFKVNTIAPVLISQALIEQVAKSERKIIVNMASGLASLELNTSSGYFIYRAAKAALNMVSRSMAVDLKPRGITVLALRPGVVIGSGMGTPSVANVTFEQSVSGMKKILDNIQLEESGSYINFDGNRLPW